MKTYHLKVRLFKNTPSLHQHQKIFLNVHRKEP